MIVTVFPVTVVLHVMITFFCASEKCKPLDTFQPVLIFVGLQLMPKAISLLISSSFSHFFNLSRNKKNILFYMFVLQVLLVISGSVEVNPGPGQRKESNLSFTTWNLDSLPAREYARIPLIEAFQASYGFDMLGICESSLNKDILNDNIFIDGFSADPFRSDKPAQIRNGGVCLYFKEGLPILERSDLETLPETIVAEIKLNRKKIFFVLSYCHPGLTKEKIEEYTTGLENIYKCISKENPSICIITGDFNARSPLFWENDNENVCSMTFLYQITWKN